MSKEAVKAGIEIIEKTNNFWRDSLRDYNMPENIINVIYSDVSVAAEHFKKKYNHEAN